MVRLSIRSPQIRFDHSLYIRPSLFALAVSSLVFCFLVAVCVWRNAIDGSFDIVLRVSIPFYVLFPCSPLFSKALLRMYESLKAEHDALKAYHKSTTEQNESLRVSVL